MNLQLTGHHLEITPALRDYLLSKLVRISNHFDHVIDVSNADRFNQDIQGSKKVIFSKVGHVPMEEVPGKVADELVHFVGALK